MKSGVFAPITGAWIETEPKYIPIDTVASHPSRVRGLKHYHLTVPYGLKFAPITGAWIETNVIVLKPSLFSIRTHHGCVD